MNIWLDDESSRPPLPSFLPNCIWVRGASDCEDALLRYESDVQKLSLDFDLGRGGLTGEYVLTQLLNHICLGRFSVPFHIYSHSRNDLGRKLLRRYTEDIYRSWGVDWDLSDFEIDYGQARSASKLS